MSKTEPDPACRTVRGCLSRFRRSLCSFISTYSPKSFSDLCSGGSALAAISGAVAVGVGVWQYDARERGAQEIRDFSFFFPSVEDVGMHVEFQPLRSFGGGEAPGFRYELLWKFKNTGNLPLIYHPRLLALGYWTEARGFATIPPFVDRTTYPFLAGTDISINRDYLFSNDRLAAVGPNNESLALVQTLLETPPEVGSVVCLHMSVDFEPVLGGAEDVLFAEHNPRDYSHTLTRSGAYTVPAPSTASHLEYVQQERLRATANGICSAHLSKAVVQTYALIRLENLADGADYRASIERAYPNIFEQYDLKNGIPTYGDGVE